MKQTKYKGYYITYFPMEEKWKIFSHNHTIMSNFLHSKKLQF